MQVHLQLTDRQDEMVVWWVTKQNVKSVVEYSTDGSKWSTATNWGGPQQQDFGSHTSGATIICLVDCLGSIETTYIIDAGLPVLSWPLTCHISARRFFILMMKYCHNGGDGRLVIS